MQKIVINDQAGGFGLSPQAIRLARVLSGNPQWENAIIEGECYPDGKISKYTHIRRIESKRDDPVLIKVIEILGIEKASGEGCTLKIVEVPAGVEWQLSETDNGYEYIREKHRSW